MVYQKDLMNHHQGLHISIIKKKTFTEMAATVMMVRRMARGVEAMVANPRMVG